MRLLFDRDMTEHTNMYTQGGDKGVMSHYRPKIGLGNIHVNPIMLTYLNKLHPG